MRRIGLAAAIVTMAFTRTASAGDDLGDLAGLLSESVVSGASKTAETSSDAPAVSTTISGRELRQYGIRTLDEAVQFLSLGMSVERDNLGFAQFSSRGVNFSQDWGDHLLLVIDGHVINDTGFGVVYPDKMLGIPIEAIDHLEVILGPGSVLYGSDAMLGTLNVVTKRAADLGGLHVHTEGSLSPGQDRYGSLGTAGAGGLGYQYRLGASFGHEWKMLGTNAEMTVFAEYLNDKLAEFNVGPQGNGQAGNYINQNTPGFYKNPYVWGGNNSNTQLSVPGVYARFIWGNLEVSARYARWHHSMNETGPAYGLFNQKDGGGSEGYAHVDIAYHWDASERLQLRPHLYYDNYVYTDTNQYYSGVGFCPTATSDCTQSVPTFNSRVGAELMATYDWFNDARFPTMVGVDARFLNVFGKTDSYVQDDGGTPVNQQGGTAGIFRVNGQANVAAYLQQMAKVTNWLKINAGVRVDWFDKVSGLSQAYYDAPKTDTPSFLHASPRGAVVINPWKDATLKGIYSEGFRKPGAYELGFASPGFQSVNAGLSGEVVRSIEGIFEQRIGVHKTLFSFYRTWWRDMVEFTSNPAYNAANLNPTADQYPYQYRNAGSLDSWGLISSYTSTFGPLSLGIYGSVAFADLPTLTMQGASATLATQATTQYGTYACGQTVCSKQPVTGAPNLSGSAHLAYSFGEKLPTIGLVASLMGPRVAMNANAGPLASLATPGALGAPGLAHVPTTTTARLTVSGPIPNFENLTYRAFLNVVANPYTPYAVGPNNTYNAPDGTQKPDFQQVSRLTFMAGLDYRFF